MYGRINEREIDMDYLMELTALVFYKFLLLFFSSVYVGHLNALHLILLDP